MRSYTTRTVAKRTAETQAQIDAAKVMPAGPNQDRPAAPQETPEAAAAKIVGAPKPTPRGGTP